MEHGNIATKADASRSFRPRSYDQPGWTWFVTIPRAKTGPVAPTILTPSPDAVASYAAGCYTKQLMLRIFALTAFATTTSALLAQRVTEAPEPNQTVGSATTLSCQQEAIGSLSSSTDEDWFKIVLGSTSDLRVQTGPTLAGQIGDTVITLLDATGGPLRANDDGIFRDYYSELDVKNLPAGVYFVAVTAGVNAATSGGYVVDVRCEVPGTITNGFISNEGPENNDPRSGGIATNVVPPARCNGSLISTGHSGDWDFWRLLSFSATVLRIRVDGTATHPNAPADDLVIYLFDAANPPNLVAGPFFASDQDEWDQAIDVRIQSGIYQLAVRGVDGSSPGNYYIDLAPRPRASTTVFSGGCGGRTLSLPTTNAGSGSPQVLESAYVGMTYAIEGSNLGANGFAFHVVGLAPTAVDLTPLGAPGCTLEVSFVDTLFQFADAAGRATWTVTVPESAALVGTTLHSQAAVLDLSNQLGITISNRVATKIGH